MTTLNKKITLHVAVWLVVTGVSLFLIFPKLANSLEKLQEDHSEQINQLNDLRNHAAGIAIMQSDLDNLKKFSVQPTALFTSDVQLVNEIKHIESTASMTNNGLDPIGVSGSTDKAPKAPTKSAVVMIPFTVTLHGDFPSALNFIKYFEHNYFLSPITGVAFSLDDKGGLVTKISSNFYLLK